MADRVFAANMLVTGKIADTNRNAFPEASEKLTEAHAGGLVPFDLLREILTLGTVSNVNGDIWVNHDDAWVRFQPNGDMEIGIAGA